MGQVPRNYGLIGDGRLAKNLRHYFKLSEISFVQWSRKGEDDSTSPNSTFEELLSTDVILLAVSDQAIPELISQIQKNSNARVVHFSGAHHFEGAVGLHPLMTFTAQLQPMEFYQSIPFIFELGGPSFSDIFPELKNPNFPIKKELKPLYHGLCVVAGNFPQLLWNEVFKQFEEKLDIPRELLNGYLIQSLRNTLELGETATTGPIVRGDFNTIRQNVHSLENSNLKAIYENFVDAFMSKERKRSYEVDL
ncbi:MAG: DUF2520 domain-containing protein [Bdellovibrionales bacterium]|nr:DUF2520 domain-containing protein [Bdellovibrionales bacterium]